MATIGPTFYDELKAAGLAGLAFSWGSDGTIQFSAAVTKDQRAAVLAVLAAHDPKAEPKDAVRDAYVAAKDAIQAMAADANVPAAARQAVVKLGLCVEELLKYLNRRIS